MTNEELKAWRKSRKAARRAVVREAMKSNARGELLSVGLNVACENLQDIEAKAPKGESDE